MEDEEIRTLVARLARRHPSGGHVIERAGILADGTDSVAVIAWITAHGGQPEAAASATPRHGLHGSRMNDAGGTEPRAPLRFVLPPGALD